MYIGVITHLLTNFSNFLGHLQVHPGILATNEGL